MSDAPTFVFKREVMQRLRRRLADAGRSPTMVVWTDASGCHIRVLKEDGAVVQKDADDGDITEAEANHA